MCGIAGFTTFSTQFGDQSTLMQMGEAIRHRGPDAGDIYQDDGVGLCHRRLSIIDLSEAGKQPMHSHDDRYVIAFNGEIYNFPELRAPFEQQGYPFHSHTDTEVLLALYAAHGKNMLQMINGMFAFAIWDKQQKILFLARDRIGKKPLYYFRKDNDIVFASELKAMLTLDGIPRQIRLDAVHDFFAYQYVPDPKTIFQDIHKLEPGHYIELSANGFDKQQYWDISFSAVSSDNEASLKAALQQQIEDCTQRRMLADVPLGAFLSGGVDSSGIVATMAKNSETPVTTCSIGFDVEQFNETEFARLVAEQYHTRHHELVVHQNVKDNLEHIVSFFDEPFADPSLVPTYFVSELARQKVTVAIAGDGGDEVFAGYEKYSIDDIENRLRNKFPAWLRKHLFPPLAKLAGSINLRPFQRARSLLNSLSQDPAMGFYMSNAQITDDTWLQIANEKTKDALGDYHPSAITLENYQHCDGPDHLARILYTDIKTYLPGDILVKADRMSMANSLEVRAPILDYELMEFAARVPSKFKFNNGEKKYLLKEAFKDDLPDDILYRKKMGFSVPLAEWFRGEIQELARNILLTPTQGLSDYFNMIAIQKLWDEHQSGKKDHATVLWSLLMFQMWWNRYMTSIPN